MPRKARIDAPGALHHIIVRGIERRRIFSDDKDRDNFVERLGDIVTETQTGCFAWTLLPNHAHILLRTGQLPLATVMRRLLTGYAVSQSVLDEAKEQLEERYRLHARGYDLEKITIRVASELGIDGKQVWAPGKQPLTVKARSLLCYWAVRKLGISATDLSIKLGISQPAVSLSVKRGETIAHMEQIVLDKFEKY
jgi:REP element-mobilizing transposase RayT